MAVSASATAFSTAAPQFRLKATDGKTYSLDDIAGPRGTVIVFPSFLPHRIRTLTRGTRYALVAWGHGPAFR